MKTTVRNIIKKINAEGIRAELRSDEPMSQHSSFRTGGSADLYIRPASEEDLLRSLELLRSEGIPRFFLGGGANILVSDKGIRAAVVDLGALSLIRTGDNLLWAECGVMIDDLCDTAAKAGLSGLEFLAGMPGSLGGAVWMNARCYGSSISERLKNVRYIAEDGQLREERMESSQFSYKHSPFQDRPESLILSAELNLKPGKKETIETEMEQHREDRKKKGHYRYPCAGSVFKNNRSFGAPSGVLLESLGLKGVHRGGAQISDFHANIIINRDHASADDIRFLVELCRKKAQTELGIELEPEIRFIGDWS